MADTVTVSGWERRGGEGEEEGAWFHRGDPLEFPLPEIVKFCMVFGQTRRYNILTL